MVAAGVDGQTISLVWCHIFRGKNDDPEATRVRRAERSGRRGAYIFDATIVPKPRQPSASKINDYRNLRPPTVNLPSPSSGYRTSLASLRF
jgi:hypothetical protein